MLRIEGGIVGTCLLNTSIFFNNPLFVIALSFYVFIGFINFDMRSFFLLFFSFYLQELFTLFLEIKLVYIIETYI